MKDSELVNGRKDTWRQDEPRAQSVVILSSIEGNLLNMKDGIGDPKEQVKRLLKNVEELKLLCFTHLPLQWKTLDYEFLEGK